MFCTLMTTFFFLHAAGDLILIIIMKVVTIVECSFLIGIFFIFSVEIKKGGLGSNSSVILAHDCINGSAYSRELVTVS